ncbi:minor tail protein [Arthrobacter phage Wollypog]|uniref:Minor tail protein n=1 Tax=Arthrobacter phage Wollypog TaxID=2790985 RepID=A0A7T3KC73_9CAUD|nr:minor tail protein [Arthrobacter phage Wollypog]QPX62572.1 minor tail protein [Arthrobacter phage Wollypog]
MAGKGSERLAQAANGGPEAQAPLQLRSGTITAINTGVTPWTCTVTIGQTSVPEVNMLGWLDPRVGDEVQCLQVGPSILVLGTVGPAKVYVPPSPSPAPPAPVVPPPAPGKPGGAPVVKAYAISPDASGTYPSQQPIGSWSNVKLWQGGAIAQRAYWFYGNKIAAAKGAGTIVSGTIFIKRWTAGGVFGEANVRLGSHGFTSQSGSPTGALGNVTRVGGLAQGKGKTFVLPASIIAGMNAGTVKGLGLEPGALGYVTPDYLVAYPYASGSLWSGALSLNIRK